MLQGVVWISRATTTRAAARDLGLTPSNIDKSLHVDPGNFLRYVHVDDEYHSGDDRIIRYMVHTLKHTFLVKKVDYLSNVGDSILKIYAEKWREPNFGTVHHIKSTC